MYLKEKLRFNTAMKKNVLFVLSNFLILLSGFFTFFIYGNKTTGVFNTLVFGTIQGFFFSNTYFPVICLGALFMIPKLSLYQLQKQSSPHEIIKLLLHKSILIGAMLVLSSVSAATITSLFWISKIKLNLFRELGDLILYALMQAWFIVIVFVIGLAKQVTKRKLILGIFVFTLILLNFWSANNNISFYWKIAFAGISSFFKKINYLDLLLQIVELLLSMLIILQISQEILKKVDY